MKLRFEKHLPERIFVEVDWSAVPRIGDAVDLDDEEGVEDPPIVQGMVGVVKSVTWFADGSVRIVIA